MRIDSPPPGSTGLAATWAEVIETITSTIPLAITDAIKRADFLA